MLSAILVPKSFHSMPHSSFPTLHSMMLGWFLSRRIMFSSSLTCSLLTPVRRFSSITRNPSLSHASSICGVMGLWLERYALHPNFFSCSRRHSCRASGMPAPVPAWSWCMFTPLSFTGLPLRMKPLSGSKAICLIPVVVKYVSTVDSLTMTSVVTVYRLGASQLHKCGFFTVIFTAVMSLAFASISCPGTSDVPAMLPEASLRVCLSI